MPSDELLHRELIASPRMRRAEAVDPRGFCVIQIRELQDDPAAGRFSILLAHMSGLPAADLHKIGLARKSCLEESLGDVAL
jgi:hypothetical protein